MSAVLYTSRALLALALALPLRAQERTLSKLKDILDVAEEDEEEEKEEELKRGGLEESTTLQGRSNIITIHVYSHLRQSRPLAGNLKWENTTLEGIDGSSILESRILLLLLLVGIYPGKYLGIQLHECKLKAVYYAKIQSNESSHLSSTTSM